MASLSKQLLGIFKRKVDARKYIPEVDGLRFAAILFVFIQHLSERLQLHGAEEYAVMAEKSGVAWLASRGTIGVMIFFTLSGFILALPFIKRLNSGQGLGSYGGYLKRRITRIEPPYLIWMTVFFLILVVQDPMSIGSLFQHWTTSIIYLHNFIFNTYSIINPVAWSLEVEWQFYLLAPFLVLLYFRIGSSLKRSIIGIGSILLFNSIPYAFDLQGMPWKASLVGNFVHFALGIILADLYYAGKLNASTKNVFAWDLLSLVGLISLPFSWSSDPIWQIVFLIGTGLFFIGIFKGRIWNRIFTNPWIATIGGMCYTIYLVHLPLLEGLTRITGSVWLPLGFAGNLIFQFIILSVPILCFSAAAYLLIERPFMTGGGKVWSPEVAVRGIRRLVPEIRYSRIIKFLLLPILVLLPRISQAQLETGVVAEDDPILNIDLSKPEIIQLKPLEELIELALDHSAELDIQRLKVDQFDEHMKLMKREWSDYISVGGSYQYGSGAYLDAINSLSLAEMRYNNRQSSLYTVGVFIRVPMSEVLNRGSRANIIRSNKQIEELSAIDIQNRLRELVVSYYNNIESKIRILRIKSQELQSLSLAVHMAEKYLEEGVLDIDEYTTAISRHARSAREFEELQAEALTSCYLLKQLVGSPIIKSADLKIYDQ